MSVFNSLYAGQYDTIYAEKNYKSECDLLEQVIQRHASSPTIDIGCGTGEHAIEMVARNYKLTGIDFSEWMIEKAKQKSELLPESKRPSWICGDARSFNTEKQYDLAIMMFAVIGYLTTNEDIISGLRNIRRHLHPCSLFVCDFWYGPSVLSMRPTDRIRAFKTPNSQGIRVARTSLDSMSHTAEVTFNLWSIENNIFKGETIETHCVRYYFPKEFELLLSNSGFKLKSLTAFPLLDIPPNEETWNALCVAEAV